MIDFNNMNLTLSNSLIDKYFGFLNRLDNLSKKRLIIKLTESLDVSNKKPFDIKKLYGAWKDTRDSDEIINEIISSRINYGKIEEF